MLYNTEHLIILTITGNHDITLDPPFYGENGANFHSQNLQVPSECIALLQSSTSITYLNHESRAIRLNRAEGPHTEFKVFGSPYSPRKGNWAFQYPPEEAQDLWNRIPLDIDVLITHTPPKFHCDESKDREPAGCEALREALWRVRPRLSVHGHVHEARGSNLVTWDLECPNITFKEKATTYWVDVSIGTKKLSVVDLTSKGGEPLDWSDGRAGGDKSQSHVLTSSDHISKVNTKAEKTCGLSSISKSKKAAKSRQESPGRLARSTAPKEIQQTSKFPDSQDSEASRMGDGVQRAGSATRGRGGSPTSGRSDRDALAGRLGRKQTCIVNAAIMATSWPYKGSGGDRYNKPIVVDIELPVWSGDEDPKY